MKRERHSRRHATVLGLQPLQRLDGLGVAQDDGNLPPLVAEGGLPLRAGLGVSHELLGGNEVGGRVDVLREDAHFVANSELRDQDAVAPQLRNDEAARIVTGFDHFPKLHNLTDVHFLAPVGPIPTMSLRYSVTSDNARTISNIFLNGVQEAA